ncbi:MAG: recombinase family protein [Cellulomonadaceae bacterium]|nr:recombinase family protein [Cellulomonadaceae bacterium]
MRVLGVVRLSRTDAASTSVERQREAIERWAGGTGHEIVAWAIDDGVSGDIAPWKRPSLGPFLPQSLGTRDAKPRDVARAVAESRAGEWDAIVVWKLDRLARRAGDMLAVIDWCRATGRQVWEASGTEYTGPAGTILVSVLGGLAQGERERMVERARSSFDKLSRSGRWRGGHAPWGYRVVDGEDGHKRLEVDDEQAVIVREVAARVIAGESINSLAAELQRRNVPTPSGRGEWRMGNLQRAIKSDRLLGFMVREDKRPGEERREYVVKGEDGLPVQRAEPILTRAELSAIRAKLAENRSGAGRRVGARADRAMLLRVLFCGECAALHDRDEPMYRFTGGRGTLYYRCGSRSRSGTDQCQNRAARVADVEEAVTALVLSTWGDEPVVERQWEAGSQTAEQIAELTDALAMLREDRAAGLYSSPSGVEEFRAMYGRLERQRAELEAVEQVPSGWKLVDTGRTLRDRWADADDDAARNELLRLSGLRFYLERGEARAEAADRLLVALPVPAGSEVEGRDGGELVALGMGTVRARVAQVVDSGGLSAGQGG